MCFPNQTAGTTGRFNNQFILTRELIFSHTLHTPSLLLSLCFQFFRSLLLASMIIERLSKTQKNAIPSVERSSKEIHCTHRFKCRVIFFCVWTGPWQCSRICISLRLLCFKIKWIVFVPSTVAYTIQIRSKWLEVVYNWTNFGKNGDFVHRNSAEWVFWLRLNTLYQPYRQILPLLWNIICFFLFSLCSPLFFRNCNYKITWSKYTHLYEPRYTG